MGWDDYETGPFCRHWGDPSDCDEVCKTCGHGCTRHGANDGDWSCFDCDCEKWMEVDDG